MANPIGFRITGGKGFHVTFQNGWTVSVQFGPGNYCLNRHDSFAAEAETGKRGSPDAEVAAWPRTGELVNLGNDTVRGWQSPADVLALMVEVAALPDDATTLPSVESRHA